MSLLTIWKANPGEIEEKQISQLVALAGDGKLKDGNQTSTELREFFGVAPTPLLGQFLDQFLLSSFDDGGFVLQE